MEYIVLQVITPPIEAVKEVWTLKENSRRELLLGAPMDGKRRTKPLNLDNKASSVSGYIELNTE